MPTNSDPYHNRSYAWYMVILMTIAYMFSFIDRYILGLLIEPIKQDLQLTDTQIGLLLGPAFAIFYATMGLPMGYLVDRIKRIWIVSIGIFVWSMATAASGLTQKFSQLFIARMTIGVGEATLTPCSLSMISDSFPETNRGRAIGVYTMGMGLGSGFAYLFGSVILAWVNSVENLSLPILGEIEPWQFAFIAVGLPGVFLALLVSALKEPKRKVSPTHNGQHLNIAQTIKYIWARKQAFGSFILPASVMTIIAYSHSWLAPMFERTWGIPASRFAFIFGLLLLCIGPVSNNLAGWLADHWVKKGRPDGGLLVVILGTVILIPTAIIAPLVPSATLCFIVLGINSCGIALTSTSAQIALIKLTPENIKGTSVAFYLMCISITGLLLGPTTIGLLNDYLFGVENIRYSMSLVPLIFGVPVLMMIPYMRRNYLSEINNPTFTEHRV